MQQADFVGSTVRRIASRTFLMVAPFSLLDNFFSKNSVPFSIYVRAAKPDITGSAVVTASHRK
jgi:hypothetical protein